MIRTVHHRLVTRLLPGLVFASALTTHVFGAGEQSNLPNFSSIDRPWVASEGGEVFWTRGSLHFHKRSAV
jgi:hypothetical protein